MMFGEKPDMHRIKKFGSIAYAHKPTGPSRRKMDENCRIGFLAGYREGKTGFGVYFPQGRVVQRVEHAHINEGIVFNDRYSEEYTPTATEWINSLEDEALEPTDVSDFNESALEEQNIVEDTMEDPDELPPARAAGPLDPDLIDYDDLDEMPDVVMDDEPATKGWNATSGYPAFPRKSDQPAAEPKEWQRLGEDEDLEGKAPPDPALLAEVELCQEEIASEEEHEAELQVNPDEGPSEVEPEKEPTPSTDQESTESTLGETTSDDSESSPDPWQLNVQDVSGAYMFVPLQDEETDGRKETREQDEDQHPEDPDPPNDEHSIVAVEAGNGIDVCMLTGKPRTPLEAELDDVREVKRQRMLEGQPTRMTLRSADERRRPKHLDDYQIFASYCQQDHTKAENGEHRERRLHSKEITIPRNFREAMKSPQKEEWLKAMQQEVDAMLSKGVFVMIDDYEMPNRTNLLSTMWRYQPKTGKDGYVTRWRARLVGRGDPQEFGVDCVLSFSPVARMVTTRVVIAVAAKLGLTLYQGDINTSYLNALLKIKQFVRGIPGFSWPKGKVYRVDHALYGLHQSGAEWYEEVDKFLRSQGYDNTETEPCLYVRYKDGVLALIPLYVNDVVLATNSEDYKTHLFLEFDKKYGFKDGGLANKFLGVKIEQSESGILIHQEQYCKEVLDRFGYGQAHGSATPMETNVKFKPNEESEKNEDLSFDYRAAIGSLMYLTTSTRPDIAFPVGYLSRFVSNPSKKHGGAVKRILRYLAATSRQGIKYSNDKDITDQIMVNGHSDADWGNDPETRKSVTEFVMTIAGGAVAWAARRQTIVAQSTAEAEYVAACEAAMEGRGIANMLNEALVVIQKKSKLMLGVDNTAAIALAKAPTYNSRTRHIELRWHYVRDQVKRDLLEIHKMLR
ncbi:hypothetical protein PF010_g3399 [Phytophthora fragariae]|uniref:Uncharacterized protein n=1 Tax=Phytophthora fragariae TaxID=53985 RepID=A0A6G0PMK1_9STRA|nr:hypothetical protein PF010_g3399 [Phytophthora fragariae]KAE9249814.1 hypothetical protein PF004_g3223 [Phytophthora fragariae]